MKEKSVGLNILWWAEAIVAVRAMLFAAPVMINKYLAKTFSLSGLDDRFIAVMAATALLYLLTGVSSIFGFRFWKMLHYLAAIFTLALTAGSLNLLGRPAAGVDLHYFFPVIFSVVITVLISILGKTKQTAKNRVSLSG